MAYSTSGKENKPLAMTRDNKIGSKKAAKASKKAVVEPVVEDTVEVLEVAEIASESVLEVSEETE